MSYTHLTQEERFCLGEQLKKEKSIREIAQMLGRSPSTISRELKRNNTQKGYVPYYAHCQTLGRRRKAKNSGLQSEPEKKLYVIEKLQSFWTPEQISKRWQAEHPESTISVSTIYRHIKRKWLPGVTAKANLRRHGRHKLHCRCKFNTIHPDRIIPQWPDEIRQRLRLGDWEGDTINGARGKGCAITLVDRKTGFLCGRVIHTKDASTTRKALVDALKDMPVCSLSLDNGSEFAEFREIEAQLHAPVFFAEPHKPWQRGCNENANDLLRFFFPKGCDFTLVSQHDFDRVLALINSRPRKRLNWLSPAEIFPVALV